MVDRHFHSLLDIKIQTSTSGVPKYNYPLYAVCFEIKEV